MMAKTEGEQPDPAKLKRLLGKVMGDLASAAGILMAYMGDQAGVYRALDAGGPQTIEELSQRTGINPKYLREWLGANAAAGYVTYTPGPETFSLSPEQALVLSREGQQACLQGLIQAVVSQYETHPQAVETFKSGSGRPWNAHSASCFCALQRSFPGIGAKIVEEWIPALDGVEPKLKRGGRIADIGCGLGESTLLMARTYPNSVVHGFDFHEPSIAEARAKAQAEGLSNVEFFVARAQDFPGADYDFACIFDALHDMGDPVGAARRIREALKPDGAFMLVEPLAGDSMSENLHPVGQIFYAFSTTVCTPASLSQEVGLGLGAQAGQKRLTEVLNAAGFSSAKRVAETPTNMVLDVRV